MKFLVKTKKATSKKKTKEKQEKSHVNHIKNNSLFQKAYIKTSSQLEALK